MSLRSCQHLFSHKNTFAIFFLHPQLFATNLSLVEFNYFASHLNINFSETLQGIKFALLFHTFVGFYGENLRILCKKSYRIKCCVLVPNRVPHFLPAIFFCCKKFILFHKSTTRHKIKQKYYLYPSPF